MRPRDLTALEFPRVCARLAEFAVSAPGKEACLGRTPTADRATAEREIERTAQALRLLETHGDAPLTGFPDVRPHLRTAAHEGFVLDGKALVEVGTVLTVARELSVFFRRHLATAPALADVPNRVRAFPSLENSLARALDDHGNVLDQASDELAAVRHTIRTLRDTLARRLEELVGRASMAELVSDTYVTVRNNRFVIPIRAGAVGRIQGVVQDRSISGETVFIEPLFAVELNNQLLIAVREEEAVVRRILADLTALIRADHDELAAAFAALVGVDELLAAAKFARAYRCTPATFTTDGIHLRAARHAGLLFTGRPVTPIDLQLPAGKRVLVITGPNTGGKTVALKTLGLSALMAQSGLLIPAADGAGLPCFSAIFADVGDEQNIDRNLSTFSAHIANLCEILATEASAPLVLLDEPGVGTDPEEGAALAIGLLQSLAGMNARVAITTHYNPVKLFALGEARCVLAAVDFDVDTLTPRYRLSYHSLGRSLALPIARRLGLPEAVLSAARAAQSDESRALGTALERLETARRGFEEQLEEVTRRAQTVTARDAESQRLLEELRQRRRTVWNEELREAREFVRRIKDEGRELLSHLQRGADRATLHRFVRQQEDAIAAHATETVEEIVSSPGPLRTGDTVEVGDRGIRGELLSVDGGRAWIQRGTLRFEVPAAQLRRVGRQAAAPVQVHVAGGTDDASTEISLIGLRAREAVDQLHRFLDHAVQAQHQSVRIIHGIGSGALRRAVHDYLSTSPYCSSYRGAEAEEGGAGVTVAVLDS